MENDFWLQRWQRGEIGWHLTRVHPKLQRCWPQVSSNSDSRVLVPLCGKTLDLIWLSQHCHDVLAIELSSQAVSEFFEEQQLVPERKHSGDYEVWSCGNIRILCGDIFALQATDVAGITHVYDRAALVAMTAEQRPRYVRHLQTLLPVGISMLLIDLIYQQDLLSGPPFSVPETELTELFSEQTHINCLMDQEIIEQEPRFASRGLSSLRELVYAINW